jgi:hypothetical protein
MGLHADGGALGKWNKCGHNQQSRGGSGVPRKIAMNGTVNMPFCDAGWEKSISAKKDSN